MHFQVQVKLKKGVADPEGDNTLKALRLLGFRGISTVHTAKLFEIEVDENNEKRAREDVEEMCKRLLANPVIQDFKIETL